LKSKFFMPMLFKGLYTAVVTPFTNSGKIDKEAFKEHLDHQLSNNISGLVICGTTGESPSITDTEFDYLLTTARAFCGSDCQIIAGTGTNGTKKSIERSLIAQNLEADALLIVSPYYNKPTQNGIKAHYTAVADAVNIPLMIYNVPGRTSVNILPKTIAEMAKHPNIACIKEASGDMQQIMDIIKAVPDNFPVLSGDDAMTLPLIAAGGKGLVSVASNQVPGLMNDYVQACLDGNLTKAQNLHYKLLPLMKANFWQSNPITVKAALSLMGRMQNNLRLPMTPLDGGYKEELQQILKDLNLI